MKKISEGYLVVLKSIQDEYETKYELINRYKGMNRLPSYPLADHFHPPYYDMEIEGLNFYILGNVRNCETGLLSSIKEASEVLNYFKHSYRKYEIIFVKCIDEIIKNGVFGEIKKGEMLLGYDVGSFYNFYSFILYYLIDKPSETYYVKLNEYGLFSDYDVAKKFQEFCKNKYKDHSENIHMFEVYCVDISEIEGGLNNWSFRLESG